MQDFQTLVDQTGRAVVIVPAEYLEKLAAELERLRAARDAAWVDGVAHVWAAADKRRRLAKTARRIRSGTLTQAGAVRALKAEARQ